MLRYARTEQLLGREQVERLKNAHVTVCGLGAVGSFAVEALARAGVGHLRLVDFDVVDKTNINRQLYALESTIDKPKADVARQRVLDINPGVDIQVLETFIDDNSIESVLADPVEVLVDAIDSVSSKVELVARAYQRGIHVVSCMGAAGKLDANAVITGDLSETRICPLARVMRQRLRKKGIDKGIRCVYSTESPKHKRPPVVDEGTDFDKHPERKRTPIGSISYVTAIAGLKSAYEAIDHILSSPADFSREKMAG